MTTTVDHAVTTGRFAPSPTGRMHLGNVFTALISWLSVRKAGGRWILRIEDLDPQRSRPEHALMIEDDLEWLGLTWDEGGMDDRGSRGPYRQSMRADVYAQGRQRLRATGLAYPCTCTRADIMATQAPHQSDGRVIYSGRCRPPHLPAQTEWPQRPHATRLYAPDRMISFTDRVYGPQTVNLAKECGDFILQRADGAWAYQLAVVMDDAMMGVTEVVRGNDLLLSTGQQLYLYDLLGLQAPAYAHLPLISNAQGQRLSKRDQAMSMAQLRLNYSAEEVTGILAYMAGIQKDCSPCRAADLIERFSWSAITPRHQITAPPTT